MRALIAVALLLSAPAASARTLGSITFTPCTLEGRGSSARSVEAECARFEVAENPAAPAGRKIALQLALVPARSGAAEPDPVVMLAGGPGQSAVEVFPEVSAAFEPLRKHRHILLIDQRGTGRSNPLKCPLPDWKDPKAQSPAALRQQAAGCLVKLSERSDPRFYTTTDAIRDLEAVRQALGAPRLNVIGGSYGTRVALEYLRRHPEGVRTVVIDSVVPPGLALGQDHASNLDDVVRRNLAACRADASCFKRFGDPAETLAQLRAQLKAPRHTTLRDPRTHGVSEETLSGDLLAAVIRLYSYEPEVVAVLPLLIDEAAHGRPESLVAQGEMMFERLSDSLAHGMELSVICAEDAPFLKPRPEDAGTLLGDQFAALAQQQCAVWPRGDMPADFKQPVVSDTPVLLLSGELDPVTPKRYAEQVARTLSHSRQLVLKGQGHTVMGRGCAPKLVAQFVASADPAAPDAACLEALGRMPFFTSYQGSEP